MAMGSDGTGKAAVATAPYRWRETLAIPPIESPFFESMIAGAGLDPEVEALVRGLHDTGYASFDPALVDFEDTVVRLRADLEGRYDEHRRVSEAWYWNRDVRNLAVAPRVLELLRLVYQRDPIPFQTLNFEVGTEQPAHSDTIHFHCLPKFYMCGVWIALEDIHPDAGPLVVYPGSHRLPDYDMQDLGVTPEPESYHEYEEFVREMLAAAGIEPVRLTPKKGQAVMWLANLYHGGSPIHDRSLTRASQVTHYYFENCQYTFPMQCDLSVGRITRREVIDLRTGEFVTHRHEGRKVELGDLSKVCTYPRPLPKWVG
jgi:hypothetical protein